MYQHPAQDLCCNLPHRLFHPDKILCRLEILNRYLILRIGGNAMLKLIYFGDQNPYQVKFRKINENVVELTGEFPVKTNGFYLSRLNESDAWDYTDFKTIYKMLENGAQFSNDGSHSDTPENPEEKPLRTTVEELKRNVDALNSALINKL